jgi:hypothetical protein
MQVFRTTALLSCALALAAPGLARADVIELTDAQTMPGKDKSDNGVAAINGAGVDQYAVPGLMGTQNRMCLRGRFRTFRQNPDGKWNVSDAHKYFVFDVYDTKLKTWVPDPFNGQWHWTWVAGSRQEIDLVTDFEWLFSDRERVYDRPLDALANAIDPDGSMGIGGKPAPSQIQGGDQAFKFEGVVSRFLVEDRFKNLQQREDERKKRIADAHPKNMTDPAWKQCCPIDCDFADISPERTMAMLVEAEARTRPRSVSWPATYPETEDTTISGNQLIFTGARTIAQWIGETLSNAVSDSKQAQDVGRPGLSPCKGIHDWAYTARRMLLGYIEKASPDALKIHKVKDARMLASSPNDPLVLDDVDMAKAALDILHWQDGSNESGLLTARREDVGRVVDVLIAVASASDELVPSPGGPPPISHPLQVTLANQALATLSALANRATTSEDHADFRSAIEDAFAKLSPDSPRASAAREALIEAGFASKDEIQGAIDRLFNIALESRSTDGSSVNPRRAEAVATIKALKQRLASGDLGGAVQDKVQSLLNSLQKRQDSGQGDRDEKQLLNLLQ